MEQLDTEEDGWTDELHFLSFVPALLDATNKKALSLFVGFAWLYECQGKGKGLTDFFLLSQIKSGSKQDFLIIYDGLL